MDWLEDLRLDYMWGDLAPQTEGMVEVERGRASMEAALLWVTGVEHRCDGAV